MPCYGATPLNVAVARVETLWLVTTSPTCTVAAIEMLSLPMSVQLVPVVDRYAETVEPLRTKRTQDGAVPAPPTVVALEPSVVTRRWNARPFAGVTATNAFREPAPRVSRIMTPALAHPLVFCSDATCAMISPSPVSIRYAKWN